MMSIDPEIVDVVASALADDWNPERDPILTAMFRDHAQTALEAALPHLEQQIREQVADEIENRASQPRMEDSAPQWSVAKLQRDAYINGLSRAAQIARKENTND